MLSWLLARPFWVWALLGILVYAGVQEWRIRRLHARLDDAGLEQMAKDRAAQQEDLKAIRSQRSFLDQAVQQNTAEVSRLKRELEGFKSEVAKKETERKRLVESGTVSEVVDLGKSLGYNPVPMRRPQ